MEAYQNGKAFRSIKRQQKKKGGFEQKKTRPEWHGDHGDDQNGMQEKWKGCHFSIENKRIEKDTNLRRETGEIIKIKRV